MTSSNIDPGSAAGTALSDGDLKLVGALRQGDEAAFVMLIEHYQPSMVRLAMVYVHNQAVAEEVTQEAWLGVLQGIGRFEGRSSLKTWIFRILTNCAKTRGQREGRSIPFSALGDLDIDAAEPAVDPDRFLPADHPRWPGHWAAAPQRWDATVEEQLLAKETRAAIDGAIHALPAAQQAVITLRDVEGWPADEVCRLLGITEANQRVLLHRARSKVRRTLEQLLQGE